MKWSEICIHTTENAVEPVTGILYEAGAGGVAIEDATDLDRNSENDGTVYDLDPDDYPEEGVNVKAYLPLNSFLGETVGEIRQSLEHLESCGFNPGDHKVTISEHNEEEWATAWKKYYRPAKVGSRFIISPAWIDNPPVKSGRQIVELDPGMAFGTGTHPTTVLCIEALEKYLEPGSRVLDVGTGSGVLSIVATKLGAEHVLGVDLDDVAVQSARLNVKLNHVDKAVSVRKNDLARGIGQKYNLIVGNLLAELVVRLASDNIGQNLEDDGVLIVSGLIRTKRDQVREALQSNHLTVCDEARNGDWLVLVARKDK
ncbi:50S ribosomal protein L11 methyltransferase [Sporolactobacillus vineae]|uniref:50S ribosomal protein L11 methyltransferase n=1 Tax=Sporolactobacillus vineae TaxID=444463 RepID=UPI000289EBFE|nr:50S ribosomal protein L11 methyltransferase [Sporolactobacillus vineae]